MGKIQKRFTMKIAPVSLSKYVKNKNKDIYPVKNLFNKFKDRFIKKEAFLATTPLVAYMPFPGMPNGNPTHDNILKKTKEEFLNRGLPFDKKYVNPYSGEPNYQGRNLLNNYDEDCKREFDKQENETHNNASNKLNDITPLTIYKVLKKLVSLSYENYQKGTYKYNKKEIIKHYLTEQKYKILDDLISPIFKPDVYVFDLSPSNDNSLEMYVNAISSVAIKGSLIYLTYNNKILRRLLIKKQNSKSIDVKEVVNSENEKYRNFECTVYNEYQSLYEELKDTKNRKIYIFSDLDISSDMVELSKKNKNIVWFSTENNNAFYSFFEREVPDDYEGLYVDTKDITDIEKYIKEKNKSRYRRRHI